MEHNSNDLRQVNNQFNQLRRQEFNLSHLSFALNPAVNSRDLSALSNPASSALNSRRKLVRHSLVHSNQVSKDRNSPLNPAQRNPALSNHHKLVQPSLGRNSPDSSDHNNRLNLVLLSRSFNNQVFSDLSSHLKSAPLSRAFSNPVFNDHNSLRKLVLFNRALNNRKHALNSRQQAQGEVRDHRGEFQPKRFNLSKAFSRSKVSNLNKVLGHDPIFQVLGRQLLEAAEPGNDRQEDKRVNNSEGKSVRHWTCAGSCRRRNSSPFGNA